MKVLVTLPSGASARSEFPLDGPEAKDIAVIEVEARGYGGQGSSIARPKA